MNMNTASANVQDKNTKNCAFCGEEMRTPYGGFELPPEHVQLMKSSDGFDPDEVVDRVSVCLCTEHTRISKRMVFEHGATPVPQCHATQVSTKDREVRGATSGGEDLGGVKDSLREEMVADAKVAVENDDPIGEYHRHGARVIILTEKEMPDPLV
jgi:hypothetical protein